MSHEILYTSAPQGLKPGSRGFCTVVSTAGIAKNLAERLESFSGYRHAFMAHEAQADQNPVNYAHYHTTVGGRKYHVLSRIADAGLDYTQRSNKLAHHVALDPDEVADAPGGPAWVMATDGFFVKQWDGQVRTLPAGRQPTGSDRPAQLCQSWKRLTGDAGWGGVLAESALRKGGVMSVIFPAGTPVLDLVVESLGLLPPEKRWEVTFSTYFTKAPAGVDCQWRFLLDGTPEATALRRDVRAAVIDLCKPLGQAQGGDLLEAARARPVSRRGPSRSEAPLPRSTPDVPRPVATTAQPRAEESGELTLAPPTPPSPARRTVPPPAWLPSAAPRRRRWWLVPIVVAGLLLIALGTVLGVVLSRPRDVPPVQVASPQPTPPPKSEPSKPPDAPAPPEPAPQEQAIQEPDGTKPTPSPSLDRPKVEEKPSVKEEKKPEPEPDPFADIRKRQRKLQLPRLTLGRSGSLDKPQANKEPIELAMLNLKDIHECKLRLFGHEFERRDAGEHRIESTDDNGKLLWKVSTRRTELINKNNVTTTPIATFTLDEGRLRFNWETDQPPLRLALCSLEITAGDKFEICTFEFASKPVPSVQLNESKAWIDLTDAVDYLLRREDDLLLDLRFSGIENAAFMGNKSLSSVKKDGTTLSIPVPSYHQNAPACKVSVRLSLNGDPEKGLCIESRMVADASELPLPSGQSWGLGPLMPTPVRKPVEVELSDDNIKAHRDKAEKGLVSFKISASKNGFAEIGDWSKLPREKRTTVAEFAKAYNEYQQLQRNPSAVDAESRKRIETLAGEINRKWPNSQELMKLCKDHGLGHGQNLFLAEQYNLFADFVEEVEAWSRAIREIKGRLQKDGRLDYRLYVKVDGREIELVRTEGFSDAKPAGDANKQVASMAVDHGATGINGTACRLESGSRRSTGGWDEHGQRLRQTIGVVVGSQVRQEYRRCASTSRLSTIF